MKNDEQKNVFDYFEKAEEKLPSFKIPEGNTEIEFTKEPKHWFNAEDQENVLIIGIKANGQSYTWFVGESKFVIINGLREMGIPLTGRKAIIGRKGTGRGKGTQYSFTEIKT